MKNVLFIIASIYLVCFFLGIFPAYVVRENLFISMYNASEKEATIIKNVCATKDKSIETTLGSLLLIYGLYAGSMFFGRKKPNRTTKKIKDESN